MMTAESFIDYFKVVFNNLYSIDVRLNNVFNSSELRGFLEGRAEVNQLEHSMGYKNDVNNLPSKLLISINQKNSTSPTLANYTGMIYTRVEYFYRMFTTDDIGLLNQRLIIGVRQNELFNGLNLYLDSKKISISLSIDGIKSVSGNLSWAGYFHRVLESRPYNTTKINIGLDNGKE